MNDHFPYIYDNGHWIRDDSLDDGWSLRAIAETVLGFAAMAVCLVAVTMLFLCG